MISYFKTILYAFIFSLLFLKGYHKVASCSEGFPDGNKRRISKIPPEEHASKKGKATSQQETSIQGKKRDHAEIEPTTSCPGESTLPKHDVILTQCTTDILHAWYKAVHSEDYNPHQANAAYEEATQSYEVRLKLLANNVSDEDYLLSAGINWITAISFQYTNPEKASRFYERAGERLSIYSRRMPEKEDSIDFRALTAMLFLKASNLIKMTSEHHAGILAYKATCLQSISPTYIKKKIKSKSFVVAGKNLACLIPPPESYLLESQPQSTITDKSYRFIQKANVCSLMAFLFESINIERSLQLYETAARLLSYAKESSDENPRCYKLLADAYWNMALTHMFSSSFNNVLFEKSLEFYTLWFDKLQNKATERDGVVVAEFYSMMAKLYAYKFPHNKLHIQTFENKVKDYYDRAKQIHEKSQGL
ncbi:MAG: hypothetical protein BGO77_06055 [Caedibacter sp. 37-49]|nr:MAG: hypothetical protein BGO77_06055 [Caedibacter sp. 37-49]